MSNTFREPLDLQPLRRFEKRREGVLRNIDLPGVHKLQDGLEVVEWNVLQDYYRVFGGVVL